MLGLRLLKTYSESYEYIMNRYKQYSQSDKDFIMNRYKQYIEEGKCINTVNILGETPLTNAVLHRHTECVRMLLDSGADPNKTDNEGYSPLLWMCYYYHTKIIKSVLDKTDNDADNELYTIYSNIFKNYPHPTRIAVKLLESPQDIREDMDIAIGFQIIASQWATPSVLDCATVRCLINRGANADLIHRVLKKALMYRVDEIKNDEIIDMLLTAGANTNI
jgi:ankyrin repeat protein